MFKLVKQSFYVDDLLMGESNDEKGLITYHGAKKLMAEGGLNLGKWKTNLLGLQRAITESESVTRSISASSDKSNSQGPSANMSIAL